MKTSFVLLFLTFCLATAAKANDFTWTSKSIKEVSLTDGRKIDFINSVEKLYTIDKKIDYLQLYNGEIIDRSIIKSFNLKHGETMFFASEGVDGGGSDGHRVV